MTLTRRPAFDEPLPSPLTSRSLRPRSEARASRATTARGGSARSSRASSILSGSSLMSTSAVAGPSRGRGTKSAHSDNTQITSRKRPRSRAASTEEEQEVDELQDEGLEPKRHRRASSRSPLMPPYADSADLGAGQSEGTKMEQSDEQEVVDELRGHAGTNATRIQSAVASPSTDAENGGIRSSRVSLDQESVAPPSLLNISLAHILNPMAIKQNASPFLTPPLGDSGSGGFLTSTGVVGNNSGTGEGGKMERSDEQEVVDELRGGVDAVSAATSSTRSAVASASQSNSDRPFGLSMNHGQPVSPKSSALSSTLAHILNPVDAGSRPSTLPPSGGSRSPIIISSPTEFTIASGSNLQRPFLSSKAESPSPPPNLVHTDAEPLSSYSCPICFFPPTNATLTPCGHVCCGSCLFTAVKTMTQRGAAVPGASEARCPVCRAEIPDWDGRGGGVIGLRSRFVFSL